MKLMPPEIPNSTPPLPLFPSPDPAPSQAPEFIFKEKKTI